MEEVFDDTDEETTTTTTTTTTTETTEEVEEYTPLYSSAYMPVYGLGMMYYDPYPYFFMDMLVLDMIL